MLMGPAPEYSCAGRGQKGVGEKEPGEWDLSPVSHIPPAVSWGHFSREQCPV